MFKRMNILMFVTLISSFSCTTIGTEITWDGGGGSSSWNVANNWNPNQVPTVDDNAKLNASANVAVTSGMNADCASLSVGYSSSSATLTVSGGTLDTTGALYVGDQSGVTGTLNISGGTTCGAVALAVGRYGTGNLNMSGGTLTGGQMYAGYAAGSKGTWTVSAGSLTSGENVLIGSYGTGVLHMTGGTITTPENFYIAYGSDSVGDVNLYGGTINVGELKMYAARSGMDIKSGRMILSGDDRATVMSYANSGWIITSDAGGTVQAEYYEDEDDTKLYRVKASSTFNFDNGGGDQLWDNVINWDLNNRWPTEVDTVKIDGNYTCKIDANMAGAKGADANYLRLGNTTSGSTLDMTGGRLYTTKNISVGYASGKSATMTNSGGIINCGNSFLAGESGTGTITISGGVTTVYNRIYVGYAAGSTGTLNISAGYTTSTNGNIVIGSGGTGTLTMTGGTLEAIQQATTGGFYIGYSAGSSGTVNLNGGVIKAKDLYMYASRSSMNVTYGVMILDGNEVATVNGYISDPNITFTAFGGTDTVKVQYSVAADKTYVWADDTTLSQTWDGSASNSWRTAANWNHNRCPFALDSARLDDTSGAVTIDKDVECDDLWGPGYATDTTGTLTINSGNITVYDEMLVARYGTGTVNMYYPANITVEDELKIASGSDSVGTFNMYSGTITATQSGKDFYCGYQGHATWNMYGGTLNVALLSVPAHSDGTSTINLWGGVINCTSISILTNSKIDIRDSGRLIIDGNVVSTINTYLSDNRVTINGSNTDSLAKVDYNVLNPGKTTVQVKNIDPLDYFLQTADVNDAWTLSNYDILSDIDPDGRDATTYTWSKGSSSENYEVWNADSNDIFLRYEIRRDYWGRRFEITGGAGTGKGVVRYRRSMSPGPGGTEILVTYSYDKSDYNSTSESYVINAAESVEDDPTYQTVQWAEITFDKGTNAGFPATDVLRRTSQWQVEGLIFEQYDCKKGYGPVNWRWCENVERYTKLHVYDEDNHIYYGGPSGTSYMYIVPDSNPPEIYAYDIVLNEQGRELEVFLWDSYWIAGTGTEYYVAVKDNSKELYFEKEYQTVPADYNLPLWGPTKTINDLPTLYTTK